MLPISPEKRKTTSYCRASLCLFISRILVKPISFDSEVRPKTPESHIILTVNILRSTQRNQAYVKRREKQQTEQQPINTSQYHNYPTAHYSFMKNAENSRLIYAEKRCYHPPSFLVVARRTSAPTKNMLPYFKPQSMLFILQCREKYPQTATVNRPYTTAESC